MTIEQINLVQQSFGAVATLPAEAVGDLFYNRLFTIAPEVRPLFARTAQPEQSRKLLAMLGYVINRLNSLETIMDDVSQLAQRHVRYGVKDHHYALVGEALLWTLEKGLGAAWTPSVEEAWTACYTLLSTAMMKSANHPVAV